MIVLLLIQLLIDFITESFIRNLLLIFRILINPASISFVDFCNTYELPRKFYDILCFVKSTLNLVKRQKVVIIIDDFLKIVTSCFVYDFLTHETVLL